LLLLCICRLLQRYEIFLGWWFVTSTSLAEVADDRRALCDRQDRQVHLVTVDDPINMQGHLHEAFPDAEIKMDVGHMIFSRIGKLLDKNHSNYRE
jgi:hypothetical protein